MTGKRDAALKSIALLHYNNHWRLWWLLKNLGTRPKWPIDAIHMTEMTDQGDWDDQDDQDDRNDRNDWNDQDDQDYQENRDDQDDQKCNEGRVINQGCAGIIIDTLYLHLQLVLCTTFTHFNLLYKLFRYDRISSVYYC